MENYNDIIGNPAVQADYCEPQMWADNCAVCAETSIIRQFGIDINQGTAAYESAANGWYMPGGGTAGSDIGNLMNLHGIDNHNVTNASISDLAQELQSGHGVIVGVRSDQLWDMGPLQELFNFLAKLAGIDTNEYFPADHAVVVTGIGYSDNGPVVYINDSGVQNGAAQAYPLDRFMDAWQNADFSYTATDNPLPSFNDNADNIDIDWGKWIPAGVSFATAYLTGSPDAGIIAGNVVSQIMNDDSIMRML